MPITKGAGNPDWNRDETLLALDLLYRHGAPIDKAHPDTVELSTLLQAALIHPAASRRPSFRNADGVALKMQNLLSAIDPSRGLSSAIMDRALTLEFPKSRANELASIAFLIRHAIARGEAADTLTDEEVFAEGHIVTSRHRRREGRLRRKLLAKLSDEQLVCTICQFNAPVIERPIMESFFEAHHIRPLADIKGITSTRLADLALLCARCHRFIHKLIVVNKRWISVEEARETYTIAQG